MAAVDPARLLRQAYDRFPQSPDRGRWYVVAAGKAAWPMAGAFAELAGPGIVSGLIAGPVAAIGTSGSRPRLPQGFERFEATHPSPNAASVAAGARALELARESASGRGRLVVLLSGGASALLASPVPEITLEEKTATASAVMRAGKRIDDLNCVRKHLSQIKGGRLGAAAPGSLTFAISDVHGPVPDDPSVIGSGLTVGDPTTFADALSIVRDVAGVPAAVRTYFERGTRGEIPETPKPDDPRLAGSVYEVIGNRVTALEGAAEQARELGYRVHVVREAIEGEARLAAQQFLASANGRSEPGRLCVIGSGETTVTVRGKGLGGRNQEFALAAAPIVAAMRRQAVVASAGTDGVDGPTDAAGAMVDSSTLERARRAGLDWQSTLEANDAYHFFRPLGDLLVWGPTGTNVGDLQILLVA